MRLFLLVALLLSILLAGCTGSSTKNLCDQKEVSYETVSQSGCEKISGCVCTASGSPTPCPVCRCEQISYQCHEDEEDSW